MPTQMIFILKSVLRNKRRAALNALGGGFSLFLLLALHSFLGYMLNPPQAPDGILRLNVAPTTSMMETLPISYLQKIEAIPHVKAVTPFMLFPSRWRDDPRSMIRSAGVIPERFAHVFPDVKFKPEAWNEFTNLKTGAMVGRDLMSAYGWKIGDRITLKGVMRQLDLEIQIVGDYTWDFRSDIIFFHYDYIDDLLDGFGRTTMFWVVADSEGSVAVLKDTIDGMFRNSGAETHTETEKAFAISMLSRIGNVRALLGSVSAVIVFTMLLVTGSNFALAMRERSKEVAILKAVGFSAGRVLSLLLGEAALLASAGGLIALALSFPMRWVPVQRISGGLIGSFRASPLDLAAMIGVGVVLGVLSALPSTLRAARMTVVEAMRRTG